MGPKNSAATRASVLSKELSWIDRMYLKLENMCVEVDKNPSILLQETSKYMETHMNVVGANVKKLCTELIQDLISPPILSSEGAEKFPECALHCKCNCIDFEKPKQTGVDLISKGSNPTAGHGVIPAKGYEEGEKIIGSINCQMQDILKGGDMKVETSQEAFATEGQDFIIEGSTWKSEVSGKELKIITGTDYGEQLNTAGGQEELKTLLEAHETGTDRVLEKRLSLPKENPGLNGEDQDDSLQAYDKNTKDDENETVGEEKCINAVAGRGEVDLAEQAIRSKENNCQDFNAVDGQITAHLNIMVQSSVIASDQRVQEVKVQQQAVDVLYETHARRANIISNICKEWHASHAKMQNSLNLKIAEQMDADDGKNLERGNVKETDEVGGDLRSMYSYVFSELSGFKEEEDAMIMSDFVSGDDFEDEEQSAHWFDGEDLKKVLHTENFCTEKLLQAEGSAKEEDSDWELV